MTERHHSDDLVGDDVSPALLDALGDEAVWVDTADGLDDAVLAAITAELDDAGLDVDLDAGVARVSDDVNADGASSGRSAQVVDLGSRRRWPTVLVSAAAAAVVFLVGFVVVSAIDDSGGDADVVLALDATDLAPGATAEAAIETTPIGTRIVLDLRDVPPAPAGTYYEAWLRVDAEIGVSAGTFHLRGGDGTIELWSGVTIDDYPLFTVTLQDEGGGAASSGRVVLRGLVGS